MQMKVFIVIYLRRRNTDVLDQLEALTALKDIHELLLIDQFHLGLTRQQATPLHGAAPKGWIR
jgi:hypothetical protein